MLKAASLRSWSSAMAYAPLRRSLHVSRPALIEKAASNFDADAAAKRLNITFETPGILAQALTHKNFRNGTVPNNERLVLLGRRALELFTTETAVQKFGVNAPSSAISDYIKQYSLRHGAVLPDAFDKLDLEAGVQCDNNGTTQGTPSLVKSKAMSALIGAVYHDKGLQAAREFVKTHLLK
ncbi:ribonuclease-III-like-domain-containing protein [Radiomyces spectabilis]|uniref:ribonuclease-III-like-domain-containing protein n=1 Tax=Radiomyces spectabilis TaxID=64574 RepID=UPI00221EE060|nr:ribonuclease-III-like-domain-containing protein [Radiomyces spectabilis]KAI8384647.1 ribonuclease-III-like-domain-containing protein [Radiomyces spectabilis]